MQRQIARALLVLLLVGVFAPVGLAMSAVPPHACCMRKMHAGHWQVPEIAARHCVNHDCCRAVIVSQTAFQQRQSNAEATENSASFRALARTTRTRTDFYSSCSGRAPPVPPLAGKS